MGDGSPRKYIMSIVSIAHTGYFLVQAWDCAFIINNGEIINRQITYFVFMSSISYYNFLQFRGCKGDRSQLKSMTSG